MLKKRLIPAMLLKKDRLVKSIQFRELRNIGNPINMARVYNAREVDELIVLDIEASVTGSSPRLELLQKIADECFMPLALGGGITSLEQIQTFLKVGADKIVLNSAALANPGLVAAAARVFGKQCLIISLDVRRNAAGEYEVYTHGGRQATGISPVNAAQQMETLGAGEIFLTSIERDGMMSGYDLELIQSVARQVQLPVIASGGAGSVTDFAQAIQIGEAEAVAAASIFHFTEITPMKVKLALQDLGIDTRM